MGRVKDLEMQWSSKPKRKLLNCGKQPHLVTYQKFMDQLNLISSLTFDGRAVDARRLLVKVCEENDLTDKHGRWKKDPVPRDELPPPDIAADAELLIRKGMSKREAFASIVVRHSIAAASWEAAIRQVKRAWEKEQPELRLDITGVLKNP